MEGNGSLPGERKPIPWELGDRAVKVRPPRGIALPVVILLLLSLTALGHGALLLSRAALTASRVSADDLQARLAAESGVREGMEIVAGRPASMDRLPRGDVVLLSVAALGPESRFRVEARRLGRFGVSVVRVGLVDWAVDAG